MRVAYVCADPGVPVFGGKGCSIHVQEVIRSLLNRGADVELYAARLGGKPPVDLAACRVHEIPVGKSKDVRERESWQLHWNKLIVDALKHRHFDLVYERYSIWCSSVMRWSRQQGIPSVLEINAPLIDEQSEHRELIQKQLARQMTRQAITEATLPYVVSSEVAPYCHQFLPPHSRVSVIANGVNTCRFSPDVPPVRAAKGFTIGFVGSLKPWHGIAELLIAFEMLCRSDRDRDCRLLIVGDGPLRDQIDAFLHVRPGLARRVESVGAVPAEMVPGYITSMDVAVAPYPDLVHFYFSPLKLFEYMASGRAIVASSIGQVREVIRDGENGLLYPAGDAGKLAACFQRLYDSESLRARLGRAALSCAKARDWNQVVEQIIELAGITGPNASCQSRKIPQAI